jgi:hypothetical protein
MEHFLAAEQLAAAAPVEWGHVVHEEAVWWISRKS